MVSSFSRTIQMKVQRFVSNDFTVRVAAVDATLVVQEMQQIQNTFPLATIGVGRAMVGALLMSAQLKPGQEVGVLLKGNGPLGSVYGQSSYEGQVRGYCPNPQYEAPQAEDVLNLHKAMGFGQLTVSRQQPFQRQPHYGTVEMVSGEVGDDIAHYLHQSQQIRSIVALGVYLDQFGKVKAAGGVLVEVMPGVEDEVIKKMEANAEKLQKFSFSQALFEGVAIPEIVSKYMEGIPFTQIPHDFEIQYHCPCTRERVVRALETLGVEELEKVIADQEVLQVQCQMCGRPYKVDPSETLTIKNELVKRSLH